MIREIAALRPPIAACYAITFLLAGCCPAGSPDYYATARGKTGPALRQALHEIIGTHRTINYRLTDEAFADTDPDPADRSRVLLIYSRRSEPASCCEGEWNREHLWPNAFGIDRRLPLFSDLHNLRPADYDVNADRGHKYFDDSPAGSPHPEAQRCRADGDSWEPPGAVKGDIARVMFYMAVRYEELELTDDPALITLEDAKMGRLSTLLRWHRDDPVSAEERRRNDEVFALQGNRNPFVDYPEWVAEIWPEAR